MTKEEFQDKMQQITASIADTRKLQQEATAEIEKAMYEELTDAKTDYVRHVSAIEQTYREKRRVNNEHWKYERMQLENMRLEVINEYRQELGQCPFLQMSNGLCVKMKGGE